MDTIKRDLPEGKLEGECDARFENVVAEFERNFRERGEVGGSLCVTLGGKKVVDVWGGLAKVAERTPWERDTVSIVFSCTKGAVALAAHVLASQGKLDIDAPV